MNLDKKGPKGNTCLPIEQIMVDTVYSITINPSDKYQFWNNPKRLLRFHAKAIEMLPLDFIEGHLFLEISPNGRLHYHGYIRILDPLNFLLLHVKRLEEYSHYEIDTIQDISDWLAYCMKQQVKYPELYTWKLNIGFLNQLRAIKVHEEKVCVLDYFDRYKNNEDI